MRRRGILISVALVALAAATFTACDPAVDDTHLTVGDQAYATSPTSGKVWACRQMTGGGGAQAEGPWFNGDGTWDRTAKIHVQGAVSWNAASVTFSVEGTTRVITSNALPDHTTGIFPIQPSDPAYAYDRNPNSILAQSITIRIPASPTLAASPSCVGNAVGIAVNGVPILNAFDAGGNDAVAHEVQDACDGHPQKSGEYHYHDISPCLDTGTGQSGMVGYAFDGFPIYGSRDANGNQIANSQLDACHGTTSEVTYQGKRVTMYHYVATHEFPYTVGCFMGTPTQVGPL